MATNRLEYVKIREDIAEFAKDTNRWSKNEPGKIYKVLDYELEKATGKMCYYVTRYTCLIPEDVIPSTKEEYDEQNFILPEKWCVQDSEEVSIWAHKTLKCKPSSEYSRKLCIIQKLFPSYESYFFLHPSEIKDYKEITFEQFKKHVLKQEDMEREIIGYKLKEDCGQYKEAAKIIADTTTDYTKDKFLPNSTTYNNFKKAGVLELWFESVYKKEFKVGDIVVVTEQCTGNNAKVGHIVVLDEIDLKDTRGIYYNVSDEYKLYGAYDNSWCRNIRLATPEEIKKATEVVFKAGSYVVITKSDFSLYDFHIGGTYKLTENFGTNYGNFRVEKDDNGDSNAYSNLKNYFTDPNYKIEVRLATQQEIDEYNKPKVTELYFGDVKFTIKKGDDFATNEYGKVYYIEFEKLLDCLNDIPKIQNVGVSLDLITIGCQKGKFSELIKIKETIENGLKN